MEITENQFLCIAKIEHYLQIEFKGSTKAQASEFISEHLENSKREDEMDTIMSHVQYEECSFI